MYTHETLQSNAKTYYYFTLIVYEILHYQLACFLFHSVICSVSGI